MNFLRRLFPDPNEKVACTDCGAAILRRTARDTGGFCTPCAQLGPDLRADRRAFQKALADGSHFRLSPTELASAAPLSHNMPDPQDWRVAPEDIPHIDGKTVQSVHQGLVSGTIQEAYFRAPSGVCLGLHQLGEWATLSYTIDDHPEIYFAHGAEAAHDQIPQEQKIWIHCTCCYQAGHAAPSKFHIPTKAALAGLGHVLNGEASAHLRWITSDDYPWLSLTQG